MNIRNRLRELRENRGIITRLLSNCDREIAELQAQCPHKNVFKSSAYEDSNWGGNGERVYWKERRVTCLDCGDISIEQTGQYEDFEEEGRAHE